MNRRKISPDPYPKVGSGSSVFYFYTNVLFPQVLSKINACSLSLVLSITQIFKMLNICYVEPRIRIDRHSVGALDPEPDFGPDPDPL
jgi:hypothetical protein